MAVAHRGGSTIEARIANAPSYMRDFSHIRAIEVATWRYQYMREFYISSIGCSSPTSTSRFIVKVLRKNIKRTCSIPFFRINFSAVFKDKHNMFYFI
jgi:hypothetical protein